MHASHGSRLARSVHTTQQGGENPAPLHCVPQKSNRRQLNRHTQTSMWVLYTQAWGKTRVQTGVVQHSGDTSNTGLSRQQVAAPASPVAASHTKRPQHADPLRVAVTRSKEPGDHTAVGTTWDHGRKGPRMSVCQRCHSSNASFTQSSVPHAERGGSAKCTAILPCQGHLCPRSASGQWRPNHCT